MYDVLLRLSKNLRLSDLFERREPSVAVIREQVVEVRFQTKRLFIASSWTSDSYGEKLAWTFLERQ